MSRGVICGMGDGGQYGEGWSVGVTGVRDVSGFRDCYRGGVRGA